jgi:hypothetical protein
VEEVILAGPLADEEAEAEADPEVDVETEEELEVVILELDMLELDEEDELEEDGAALGTAARLADPPPMVEKGVH